MANHGTTQTRSGSDHLIGLGRASAGALIFSLPMMMTMEMWWIGFWIDPLRLALLLGLLVPLLVGLSRLGGFRSNLHWLDDVADALVAIVVGGTIAALILWLFGVLTADMPVREIVGKISIQLFPASIGAMLAQNQLGSDPGKERVERTMWVSFFSWRSAPCFSHLTSRRPKRSR